MRVHRFLLAVSLLVASLLVPGVVAAQMLNCDSGFVSFSNNVVRVSPNGTDDTINIQCALDFARDNNVPTTKLSVGSFSISNLEIQGFTGTFEGTSRVNTVVTVQDFSIICDDMTDAGRTLTAIRFIGGEPRIRFMTLITGEHACFDNNQLTSQVHFTGMGANTECVNDVIFGNVDRMNFQGTSEFGGPDAGVTAWAEGHEFDTCRDTLTGSLKVNRSGFQGLRRGVVTSMQAGAQVDVNFNVFETLKRGYEMQRSNQNTTVAFNTFTGSSTNARDYHGIEVDSQGSGNPAKTSITIKDNTFNLGEQDFSLSAGYFARTEDSDSNVTAVLTGNTFNLAGESAGIVAGDSSDGTISNNRFTGTASTPIWLGVFDRNKEPTATDWSITGNTFNNIQSSAADILLDFTSDSSIIGPDQTESIIDRGTGNFILNSYPITASASPLEGGTASCSPNPVDHGSDSSCSYTANMGYTFTGWSGDCAGGSCTLSDVDSSRSVTANFTLSSYTITASANPLEGGTASCSPNPVAHGSDSSCSFTENMGFTFIGWSGDCAGDSCTLSNVVSARSVTANFTQ